MIVTAHQPNFLPGKSVIDKIAVSDAVIWLDEVQYTKGGFTNRNRIHSGRKIEEWLTVPVERLTDGKPINRVRIANHANWQKKMVRTIEQNYGSTHWAVQATISEIMRPYRLLVGLNIGLLTHFCPGGALVDGGPRWYFQSHLDGGHAVRAVSDDSEVLLPISDRLAMMVEEVGGNVYLSGPSGRKYLDESPFNERGIKVEYFSFQGANPSVLQMHTEVRV